MSLLHGERVVGAALLLGTTACLGVGAASRTAPLAGPHPLLFVGNSLTYPNDLPGTLADLAASGGDRPRAQRWRHEPGLPGPGSREAAGVRLSAHAIPPTRFGRPGELRRCPGLPGCNGPAIYGASTMRLACRSGSNRGSDGLTARINSGDHRPNG